jgi:phosphate transport system protein
MGHYEERLQLDLDVIRNRVRSIGKAVEQAIQDACRALLSDNQELATQTILGDLRINNMTRDLDRLCHVFVARHLPSARHLRFVSAVLRLSVALERIGDYAETISRSALQLSQVPPSTVTRDVELMSEQSWRLFHQAMKAWNEASPDRARATLGMAGHFGATVDKVFADLVRVGDKASRPITDLFALLGSFNRLERVSHQSKNICEETIFVATGEVKKPKTFDLLFVDEANSGLSLLAAALGRKAFPEVGTYESAGWNPAVEVDLGYREFADQHGIDLNATGPRPLDQVDLSDYQIVIDLAGNAREHLARLPFHTILLAWPQDPETSLEHQYKQVSNELSALVEKLHGIDAQPS